MFPVLQKSTAGCSRKLHCVDKKQHHLPKVQLSQVSVEHLNVKGRLWEYMQTYSIPVCAILLEPCPPPCRRNIMPYITSSYLKECEFNRSTDPDCPIFRLKHIVSEAGEDFQDMAVKVNMVIVLN